MRFGLDKRASGFSSRIFDSDLGTRFMHHNLHTTLTIPRAAYITFTA